MQSMLDVLERWHRPLHVWTLVGRWYNWQQEIHLIRAGSLLHPEVLHQERPATRSQVREERRLQRIPHGKTTSKRCRKKNMKTFMIDLSVTWTSEKRWSSWVALKTSSLKWIDLQVKTTLILPLKKKLMSIVEIGGSAQIWRIPTRCRQGIDLTSRKHCRHCTASRKRRTRSTMKIGRIVHPHGGNGTLPGGIPIMRVHHEDGLNTDRTGNLCNQWTNYSFVAWISERIWCTFYRDYIGNSQHSSLLPTGGVKSTSPDTENHDKNVCAKLYDDNNILMTNVDNNNSDTTYTDKNKNTEYNVRDTDEWAHLRTVNVRVCHTCHTHIGSSRPWVRHPILTPCTCAVVFDSLRLLLLLPPALPRLFSFPSSRCTPTTLTPWLTTCATAPRRATTATTSPSPSQFQMDRGNLIVMVANVMSLKRRSMWWETLILSPQTSNPCVRKLYCMCSKTMKHWSKWSFKEGALQWDIFPGLTELHLIGCLIDLIWIPKSKSNTSTPKTNSQTS